MTDDTSRAPATTTNPVANPLQTAIKKLETETGLVIKTVETDIGKFVKTEEGKIIAEAKAVEKWTATHTGISISVLTLAGVLFLIIFH